MKDIQNLLNQVSIISKKNAEILDATGGRFNMFGILGVDHYENTHSAILKEFLNPEGSHGLKELFLEEFIKTIFSAEDFEVIKNKYVFKSSKAYTEYPTKDGRIDILLEDNQKHAIIIENKVYAVDQWKQLKRYKEFAEEKYGKGNYLILYLTLQGTEASKDSGEGVDYIQISYSSFIIEWLEKCVHIAARYPFVRETISQYINHVRKLTNQDMDTKSQKDITDLLSKIENIEITFLIANSINHIKKDLFLVLKKIVEEIANEQELEFKFDCTWNANWQAFIFSKKEWQNIKIAFEFSNLGNGKLEYGIAWSSNSKPLELKEFIIRTFGRRHNDGWPFYTPMDSPYYDWGYSAAPWIGLLNGQTKEVIKSKVIYIIERLKLYNGQL